jgi:hypothetical protein
VSASNEPLEPLSRQSYPSAPPAPQILDDAIALPPAAGKKPAASGPVEGGAKKRARPKPDAGVRPPPPKVSHLGAQ